MLAPGAINSKCSGSSDKSADNNKTTIRLIALGRITWFFRNNEMCQTTAIPRNNNLYSTACFPVNKITAHVLSIHRYVLSLAIIFNPSQISPITRKVRASRKYNIELAQMKVKREMSERRYLLIEQWLKRE